MNKILLVKTSSLGDIVHAYPVVDSLRKKFPHAQIDWVVEAPCADLVTSHPDINRVFIISTKAWRKNVFSRKTWQSIKLFREQLRSECYDVIFDLQGNIKSGLIISQVKSPYKVGFGRNSVAEWPNLLFTNHHIHPLMKGNIREDYLSLVTGFFKDPLPIQGGIVKLKISEVQQNILNSIPTSTRPIVVVCPGSAWANKQLSKESLNAFLILLNDYLKCNFLFIWGNPSEKKIAEELHEVFFDCSEVINKIGLPLLQNLMERSDLVIAMDSLPLHLAGTTKTPSFSVFGASSSLKYKPPGRQHYAYQGNCPYGRTFEKRCPILRTCETGACIKNLQALDIFEAFKSWWSSL